MVKTGPIKPEALFTFTVELPYGTDRIDRYITDQFPHYSRSFFQRLIDEGHATVNGTKTAKPSSVVCPGDTITLQFPPARTIESSHLADSTMDVSIVATTQNFMIVYKPPHLLTHAPSSSSKAVTLADWIIHNHTDIAHVGIVDRPGIVHRLDKETSGIMIVTRTNYAHTVFGTLFKKREIAKTYLAIVAGHPKEEGTINSPIGRDLSNPIKMAAFSEYTVNETQKIGSTKVRPAQTSYKVVEYLNDAALIEIKPTTGRTHQIRVHMTSLGHPIIGDQLYGKKSSLINRQALHAHKLSFIFDETPYSFNCDIPNDFQQLITHLRVSSMD